MVKKEQYILFPSPDRSHIGQVMPDRYRPKLFELIDRIKFLKNIRINKIVSDSAKLAIRDFVDNLTTEDNLNYLHEIFDVIS